MKCDLCGKATCFGTVVKENGEFITICAECNDRRERKRIDEKLKSVDKASDFKDWKMRDMSEAFWLHLGRYKKHPNRKSLEIMNKALLWAVHADHGLSNSFHHALEWAGINLYREIERKDDLPQDFLGGAE